MDNLINSLSEFNDLSSCVRLVAAAIAGGLIGSERGKHGRAAGLRTHILICVGAAITSLIGLYLYNDSGFQGDVARISAQVISGVGFLGAGTILVKNNSMITGLTTSAGLWATAAIGVSIGYGLYLIAFVATIICLFSFIFLNKIERKTKNTNRVYIEISKRENIDAFLAYINKLDPTSVSELMPSKSGILENVGIICSTSKEINDFKDDISSKFTTFIISNNILL